MSPLGRGSEGGEERERVTLEVINGTAPVRQGGGIYHQPLRVCRPRWCCWRKRGTEVLEWVVAYGISAQFVGGEGRRERRGISGNASFGQSGAVGARVAGSFVGIIQCDTRETKAD